MKVKLSIDAHPVEVAAGQSVLSAARALGIDIPTLCYLEKCGPLNSCLVCLVKINGKLVPSCGTRAEPGMVVESETTEVHEARRTALELLFSEHVGDCLAPCNRLCPLGMNIPVMIRQIQAGRLEQASATVREALPLAGVLGRLCHHPCEQGCRRGSWDQAASIREMERVVADWSLGGGESDVQSLKSKAERSLPFGVHPLGCSEAPVADADTLKGGHRTAPSQKPTSGKSVVIVGAGPTGLAAAYYLLREGHACTIADRHERAGGTLCGEIEKGALPQEVLDGELQLLERLGVQFRLGAALGRDITLEGLTRGFDAVLVAIGQTSQAEGEALGLEMAPGGVKASPESYHTDRLGVFAAGRAVKPVSHLVRAMSEGQAAAQCIHAFLSGAILQRRGKPFSSIMGRVEKDELKVLLADASTAGSVAPCDACAGFNSGEAATEALRCLHCDCRSSGDCALQAYAQSYGADASRFRQGRRKFEQQVQPGGIIFEPGKCIRCGICVKLTELAREPLGLTFIGRGFEVRVATPFNRTIEEGLQKVAQECVEYCPTGALVFKAAP
jgi:NADPH-dependent glutamate synthase beta subunit-like oxidoreductase/ferredoxin